MFRTAFMPALSYVERHILWQTSCQDPTGCRHHSLHKIFCIAATLYIALTISPCRRGTTCHKRTHDIVTDQFSPICGLGKKGRNRQSLPKLFRRYLKRRLILKLFFHNAQDIMVMSQELPAVLFIALRIILRRSSCPVPVRTKSQNEFQAHRTGSYQAVI